MLLKNPPERALSSILFQCLHPETLCLRRGSPAWPLDGWSWLDKNRLMQPIRSTLPLILCLLTGASLGCAAKEFPPAPTGAEQIYRWTDSAGTTHFTPSLEQLPEDVRAKANALNASPNEPSMSLTEEGRWAALNIDGLSGSDAFFQAGQYGSIESESMDDPEPRRQTPRDAALDAQIADLEASVAQREDILKEMISGEAASNRDFVDQEDFRSIAQELPGMQAELKALKAQQAQP